MADGVEIRPDFSRALPVVDGDNRELFVSLGCAVENLCIAASHQELQAATSVDEEGVITINLRPGKVTPDPLLAQIKRRQTNRSLLTGTIPESDIQTLEQISPEPGTQFHIFDKNSPVFEVITEFVLRGNSRQMNNADLKNELKSWMRYNKKHQDETRDGLSYAVFGAPNLPRWISRAAMALMINEKNQNKMDQQKLAAASHLALFTTQDDSLQQWVDLGRTLQRFLLKSTELGVAHAYLNPPNEERDLAREMAERLDLPGEHPTILLRLGYGATQAYSLRRPVAEVVG